MGGLLSKVVAGAAIFGLGACAYATPYPAAFPDASGPGMAPADSGRGDGCQAAIQSPGSSTSVLTCLRSRGQAWDNRGRAIRQQAGYVGQLSIPLGIAGLGLSAGGDRSDFVPISAGVSSAALAHTGAYARPTQAEVYELATVSYRCLISAVAEWNGSGQSVVNDAYQTLLASNDAALRAVVNETFLTDPEAEGLRRQLLAQRARAAQTVARLSSDVGAALLRQSDAIDAAVIRAIRDRLPDPATVAASAARGTGSPESTPTVEPPATVATDAAKGLPPGVAAAGAPATREQEAATIVALVKQASLASEAFDAAVDAYTGVARSVSTDCAFNPSQLPALIATPAELTVDANGKGFFVVRNGVPPYGHLPLPAGVTLTPTPINGNAMRFEVNVDLARAGSGPWPLYVTDASAAGNLAEIKVSKAP